MEASRLKFDNKTGENSDRRTDSELLNDPVMHSFIIQREDFLNFIKKKPHLAISTLGPTGTTSYEAALYLKSYILNSEPSATPEITLQPHFDLVYASLLDGSSDLILIPNAYEKISDMYWDTDIYNIFNYLWRTPAYGIVSRSQRKPDHGHGTIRIAICRPVVALVEKLVHDALGPDANYELVYTISTIESARAVLEGKADYALTNEPSSKETSLSFISARHSSNVVWSVFSRK